MRALHVTRGFGCDRQAGGIRREVSKRVKTMKNFGFILTNDSISNPCPSNSLLGPRADKQDMVH